MTVLPLAHSASQLCMASMLCSYLLGGGGGGTAVSRFGHGNLFVTHSSAAGTSSSGTPAI